MRETSARKLLVQYSHELHRRGWVANHDGNLSARIDQDRIVCTPTSFSKADVEMDSLLVVDQQGKKVSGRERPFSELSLHLAIYRLRSDAHAVVHAHPPYSSALGVSGQPHAHPFLPEAVVSLGAEIPIVPLSAPGQDAVDALSPFVRKVDAVLISGNGILAWGKDLETAYLRLELVEHLTQIAHTALAFGGIQRLPAPMITQLLKKRHAGGLKCPEEQSFEITTPLDPTVEASIQAIQSAFPNIHSDRVTQLAKEAFKTARANR